MSDCNKCVVVIEYVNESSNDLARVSSLQAEEMTTPCHHVRNVIYVQVGLLILSMKLH